MAPTCRLRAAPIAVCSCALLAAFVLGDIRPVEAQNPLQVPVQAPPVFRGGTTLIPVDVRVLDKKGLPITDLQQSDFVVLENNVRQPIRHFSTQAFAAAATDAIPQPLDRSGAPTIAPQTRRVFLIVLGRGRLQEPSKGMDAVEQLLKTQLLPQDYVALMAWNRSTDFSTDHEKVLTVFNRFRKEHENIEALMKQRFSGLGAVYGGSKIPAGIQKEIDTVFYGAEAIGVRQLPTAASPDAARIAADTRQVTDALTIAEIRSNQMAGTALTNLSDSPELLGVSMPLDQYVEVSAQSMQDLSNLYTGISYLKWVTGEKHLVFVSENGIMLPRTDDDRSLAAQASDARVVMDIVHSGGTPAWTGGRGGGGMFGADWRVNTSKNVAELTGGQFTSVNYATAFMTKVDQSSRFQYLLGYAPARAEPDGKYRSISVRVLNHPGATVYYRHGYFSRRESLPMDRDRVVTYARVSAALNVTEDIRDIALTATASNVKAADGKSKEVQIDLVIAPERITFTDAGGRKKGSIDVAVFCADDRERLVGQTWNTVNFDLAPELYERSKTKGINYSGRVPVSYQVKYVKIVVYDAPADLLGATILKIK